MVNKVTFVGFRGGISIRLLVLCAFFKESNDKSFEVLISWQHNSLVNQAQVKSFLQEFVSADKQFIRVFHKDGRRKDIIDCGESITKLILCVHSHQYVSLCGNEELKVMCNFSANDDNANFRSAYSNNIVQNSEAEGLSQLVDSGLQLEIRVQKSALRPFLQTRIRR